MPFRPFKSFAVAALLAVAGLSVQAADLTVSAAASLTNAFRDIGPLFEAAHPGSKVQFNFGASGALLQQIAKGAPVDVFASADQETMDQAQKARPRQAARATSSPTRWSWSCRRRAPACRRPSPTSRSRPTQRIAIGLPASVPVGRYTKGVLEAASLWGAIEPKMIGANNVRQALDYVARAEVDAAFVYATDAALMPDKVKVALTVPTTNADPAIRSRRWPPRRTPRDAAKFVDFLFTPPAQAVLARYGFGKP